MTATRQSGPGDTERGAFKRIVLIDPTPPGGTTATGVLKETFFGSIAPESILEVHRTGTLDCMTIQAGLHAAGGTTRVYRNEAKTFAILKAFRPELLIYRPLPDAPCLHRLAMRLSHEENVPMLLWFMDDWPERLRANDPVAADAIERDLRVLAGEAAGCFAISESMANEFRDRYGGPPYGVAHNGIRLEDWTFPRQTRSPDQDIVLRYSGALAPDMSLDSMLALARAVSEQVMSGSLVRLEIRTQEHWFRRSEAMFSEMPGVTIDTAVGSQAEYRRWIAEADIGVIAYNFDDETIRYTRHSFANKVPELMAAGSAVLAIGPTEIESLRYLQDHKVAAMADRPDKIGDVLQHLLNNAALRSDLAAAARAQSSKLTLEAMRKGMAEFLYRSAPAEVCGPDAVALMRNAPAASAWKMVDRLHVSAKNTKWALDRIRSKFIESLGIARPANATTRRDVR